MMVGEKNLFSSSSFHSRASKCFNTNSSLSRWRKLQASHHFLEIPIFSLLFFVFLQGNICTTINYQLSSLITCIIITNNIHFSFFNNPKSHKLFFFFTTFFWLSCCCFTIFTFRPEFVVNHLEYTTDYYQFWTLSALKTTIKMFLLNKNPPNS